MRYMVLIGLGVLYIVGCSTMPFEEAALVSADVVDPGRVREGFALELPAKFRIVNTVTFQFRGQAIAAIGYTEVDTLRKTFTVVGLHPAGAMKLFELSGDSEDVSCKFALEEFTHQGDFARAVGDDTRRIYFDRVPAADAKIYKKKGLILFRQELAGGEIEYVFGGAEWRLLEKGYYESGQKIWSASYYEYHRKDGKLYPGGIVLKNHKYRYELVVRLREIRS